MDRYKKEFMSGVDLSKQELDDLKEAFKKEKFKELFKEYVDEVNDPQNQALYEKELIQLEKERGVDSVLLRPTPGYVIKTSVENNCQAYINVCYNEKIERPTSVRSARNGESGENWSVPHVFSKGRMEMNKERVEILVYDVLFHPMALDLAHRSPEFKKLVNDTAMTAVEDGDNVKLDRLNARVVKSNFVGGKHPCILRKVASSGKSPDSFDIPGYPFPDLEKDPEPVIKDMETRKVGPDPYTTPSYVIKERKGVDISEFRLSKDAKMMAAIPEELVVEIPLPLLRSAVDTTLDVRGKSLSLVSEEPAKYRLEVTLPYYVDDDNGSAKFDKDRKILTVTLPVLRKKYEHDFLREDSGIDSDVTHNDHQSNRSSSEEELSSCQLSDEPLPSSDLSERFSEEVKENFLDSSRAYTLPGSTVRMRSDKCFAVLHVKNIDPSSVHHQFWSSDGVWIKFSSAGGGMFPTHYAFCLCVPKGLVVDKRSLRIEVWDNNLICSTRVHSSSGKTAADPRIDKCLIGLDPEQLLEVKVTREPDDLSEDEREDSDDDEDDGFQRSRQGSEERDLENKFQECLNLHKNADPTSDDVFEETVSESSSKLESTPGLSTPSRSKSIAEEKKENDCREQEDSKPRNVGASKNQKEKKENNKVLKGMQKARTLSESSVPIPECGKRSILKTSRSLSECHADDMAGGDWSSMDSNDSPDEHTTKKTVRFNDVVYKKIFRANSSILGQRKKNEKKSRNRKKAAERRMSESEAETEKEDGSASASEVSEVSDVSEMSDISAESSDDNSTAAPTAESNKHHRRRGSKNRRKNASTAKQNYLLNRDL